jgi:hypothetical protein
MNCGLFIPLIGSISHCSDVALGDIMNRALVFTCIAFATTGFDRTVQAQTAIETFDFLMVGDAQSTCGKGAYQAHPTCKIIKAANSMTKTIVDKNGNSTVMIFNKLSDCEYKVDSTDPNGKRELRFDFSQMSAFDYNQKESRRGDDGIKEAKYLGFENYHIVIGHLRGANVKVIVDGKIQNDEDNFPISAMVSSSDVNSARDRYENAYKYFRDHYCKGSAF